MEAISIKNVSKTFNFHEKGTGWITVLDNISLSVDKGEFVGIVGPNGCGKTTLLRLIIGFDLPSSGSILISGRSSEESRIGYVAQHNVSSLYPWFTASENLAFADSYIANAKHNAIQKLADFGIAHYAHTYPYQLSGGIKQLVSIARATFKSDIFLFDEPFNALDYKNRFLVENSFLNLRDGKNSAILVSHDLESTILTCDKIIVFSEKPTVIKAILQIPLPKKRTIDTRFSLEFNIVLQELLGILNGG